LSIPDSGYISKSTAATLTAAAAIDYLGALKSGYWNILHSITCEFNNGNIIQQVPFLKIDFPRVPYPKDKNTFWQLVKLGGDIRQIHLLESPIVENYITQYPIDGDNVVIKPKHENGKVFINDT
jgi:hypothetical protein